MVFGQLNDTNIRRQKMAKGEPKPAPVLGRCHRNAFTRNAKIIFRKEARMGAKNKIKQSSADKCRGGLDVISIVKYYVSPS